MSDREKAGQKEPLDKGADVSPDDVSGVRPLKLTHTHTRNAGHKTKLSFLFY